mgnify:CR=1 FL=1
MIKWTVFAFLLFSSAVFGQGKKILVFDLVQQTVDSIAPVSFDSSITSANTVHHFGSFNAQIAPLETDTPAVPVFPGSHFTTKRRTALEYDLNSYPVRTSVKLFYVENGTMSDLCSGSIISQKHLITAAHCVSLLNSNQLLFDSIYAAPAYDNGSFNSNFPGSEVSKVYFFKNWTLQGEDVAVLEMADPIGISTGWIGIGFKNNDSLLRDDLFYKCSYPSTYNPLIDSVAYNGDTLYYNYGWVNDVTPDRISVSNANGHGGESGSSIIQVENGQRYVSYGVLSLSNNLSHSRINNWRYFAIKSIIQNDLHLQEQNLDEAFVVYPNPAGDFFRVRTIRDVDIRNMTLWDAQGRRCFAQGPIEFNKDLDISGLQDGVYFLVIETNDSIFTERLIKAKSP